MNNYYIVSYSYKISLKYKKYLYHVPLRAVYF